ncbi:MAG: cation:proton antiporter [Coriobacteriia bacterium]|nr:cation:proton antiporter [Coriobacteriia bacterium]
MDPNVWLDLLVVGTLIALGYLGARLTARFKLPSVTGFLLVGIAVGPHGIGLLSADLMHTLAFAEPLALGVIVFLIGKQLTREMLSRHHRSFWLTSVLDIVLPALLVALAVRLVAPDDPISAWLLAIIAISGAPATVMAIISEMQAKSRACDTLLGSSALDSIMTVVLYAAAAPFLMLSLKIHETVGDAMLHTATQVGGALVLGVVAGAALAWLLKHVFRDGEMLALGLVTVLIVVAAAEALGFSSLLAPLVAGIVVATAEERRGDPDRVFRSLQTVEYPVYIIFFTLAGAHLELAAALAAGLIAIAYIAARSLGKFLAGMAGALWAGYDVRQSAWVGLGMLPQAGVAVGLALAAAAAFPESGPTVNAVVLASLVFFEVLGPVLTKRAVACTLDTAESDANATGAGAACPARTVLMPVNASLPPERMLNTLAAVGCDPDCKPSIVLAHIIVPGRTRTVGDAFSSAERHLDTLARVLREEGYAVHTTVRTATTLDRGILRVAEETGAGIVAMGAPLRGPRIGPGLSPLRSTQHRVLDALDIPVLIVPLPRDDASGGVTR